MEQKAARGWIAVSLLFLAALLTAGCNERPDPLKKMKIFAKALDIASRSAENRDLPVPHHDRVTVEYFLDIIAKEMLISRIYNKSNQKAYCQVWTYDVMPYRRECKFFVKCERNLRCAFDFGEVHEEKLIIDLDDTGVVRVNGELSERVNKAGAGCFRFKDEGHIFCPTRNRQTQAPVAD